MEVYAKEELCGGSGGRRGRKTAGRRAGVLEGQENGSTVASYFEWPYCIL